MSNIVTIGFTTEGSTDKRFLESIIKKTFEEIAFQCDGLIEVFDPVYIKFKRQNGFSDDSLSIAKQAFDSGIFVLCIHADADNYADEATFSNKIEPAFKMINAYNNGVCKNLVAIVPITMSESWLLADKDLFKSEVGTQLSDTELNIDKNPESILNPKQVVEEAIKIAQVSLPKRRHRIGISEIYQPIGQKVSLEKLEKLESYKKFKTSVENAFRVLNYLH